MTNMLSNEPRLSIVPSTLIINYDDDDTDKYTININGNTMIAAYNDNKEGIIETPFMKK